MRRRAAIAGLLAVVTVGSYSSAIGNGFVKEDHQNIERGRAIGSLGNVPALFAHDAMWNSWGDRFHGAPLDTYRPLTMTTFFVEVAVFGRTPAPFHVDSVLIHLGCVLLLHAVGRALGVSERAALGGAILFAVHPAISGAVHWINGRSDPLCVLFSLAALLAWLGGPVRAGRGLAVALLFFAATLSKEAAFCLAAGMVPLILRVCPPPRGSQGGEAKRSLGRWGSLGGVVRAFAPWALGGALGLGARLFGLERVAVERDPPALAYALGRLPVIWLDGLRSLFRGHSDMQSSLFETYAAVSSWQVALGCAVAALMVAGAVWQLRRGRVLFAWGAATYLVAMAPIALLTVDEGWSGWGRYLYTASFPLALGAGALVFDRLLPRVTSVSMRRALVVGAATGALLLGAQTWLAGRAWHDDRTVALSEIADHPEVSVGYSALAVVEERAGRHARALELVDHAIRLAPRENFMHFSLRARVLMLLGRRAEAFAAARHALALDPNDQNARYVHALGLLEEGNAAESASLLLTLAREDPSYRAPRASLREGAARLGPGSPFAEALRELR